ncbi:MAG: rhodanese-like domain-containing protein [Candidatus Hodarchaeota archaeon]
MKLLKRIRSIGFIIQFMLLFITLLFSFQNFVIFTRGNSYTNILPDEAFNMMSNSTFYPDLIILDVRTQEEYNSNHICNATLIPLGDLESRISELQPFKDTEIIVYCRSGSRSAEASVILVSYNFTKVFNMLGGILAWISQGYDVCTNQNGELQSTISSSLNLFLISFLINNVILITLYKKRISKK